MSNHAEPPAQPATAQPATAQPATAQPATAQPATAQPAAAAANPTPPPTELPIGEYAALLGWDWGDHQHAIALWSKTTGPVEMHGLEHSAERVHAWLEELKIRFGGQRVAVAVEASKGAIVAALLEHPWMAIYPIHPATSRRFGTAFTPSGAKDDRPDARLLLEILQGHRHRLRLLIPQDPATRRLNLLVEARRTMVDRRTRLANELTSLLKGYYPQALELTGDKRHAPLALDFVERWPDLASLQRTKAQTLRSFFYKHQVRREETIAARLELVRTARVLSSDAALVEVSVLELQGLVDQIRALNKHVDRLDAELAAEFAQFPEAYLFEDFSSSHDHRDPKSEFQRALRGLGVAHLVAPTPQAKGKIERRFGTFQRRLVTLLAHARASSWRHSQEILQMEIARQNRTVNRSLGKFPLAIWEAQAAAGHGRMRPTPPASLRDLHFSLRCSRRVNHDHTIDFDGRNYEIAPTLRKTVTLIHHPNRQFWAIDLPPKDLWPPILGHFTL